MGIGDPSQVFVRGDHGYLQWRSLGILVRNAFWPSLPKDPPRLRTFSVTVDHIHPSWSADEGDRLERRSPANVEGSRPLRTVDLVAGQREKIDPEFIDPDWDLADALDSIGVQEDPLRSGDRTDLLKRLDGPDFVVGVHDGDEEGLCRDGLLDGFRAPPPLPQRGAMSLKP
jgi:hypothetical protein